MSSVKRTDTIVWLACSDNVPCDLIGGVLRFYGSSWNKVLRMAFCSMVFL